MAGVIWQPGGISAMRQQENNEGLSAAEAAARLAAQGFNELPASRRSGPWRLLGQALAEPMILLLAACGAVYMLLGDAGDALLLLAFVCIVVAMTFFQKRRTERSLSALRDYSSPRALVVRDGRQQRIAGRELVVGDLVLLAEGDRVPADMALSTASNFTTDESMLTGESGPVTKQAAGGGDGAHRVYSGTLVTNGTARGTVTATGADSAIGRIGASLASLDSEPTPIQRETRAVVRQVAIGGLVLAAGLGLAYWWLRGDWVGGLLAGLTLAMAVLPEELPVVLTLFLGVGAWRLARQKVLARSAPAIELLGATTILCVDKTGTLTVNRMELARLWTEQGGDDNCAGGVPLPPAARALLENAVLASHRTAYDPMEAAIANAGARLLAGMPHGDWRLIDDYPLSPQLFAMSRVWQAPGEAACRVVAKGAPEAIIELCHLDPARAARVAARVAAMAGEGLRVLGVAVAAADAANLPQHQHGFDFAFAGLLALADPLRPEVPSVVAQCHAAGMRVVMITGDHPATAMAIARQAGIAGAGGGLPDRRRPAALRRPRTAGSDQGCQCFLPHRTGAETAPGAGLSRWRRGGRHDRRRRQRRASAQGGRHRCGDGRARHRRRPRGGGAGVARGRFFPAAEGGPPWPPPVRQPAQGAGLHRRGARAHRRLVGAAVAVGRRHAADAGARAVPADHHRPGLLDRVRGRAA
jgi:Ca2+-transporting ATPase